MTYQFFLNTLITLFNNKRASIVWENTAIHLEALSENNTWRIRTPLSNASALPDAFRWQNAGPYLERDPATDTLWLVHTIEINPEKYISFKKEMGAFIDASQEWQGILKTLS